MQVLEIEIDVTDENCIGSEDGTATITVTGGTMPYSYQWSIGLDGPMITIGAGQYMVTVSDAAGNQATALAIVESTGVPMEMFYLDSDEDGYGDNLQDTLTCGQPMGYVANNEDCDDTNAEVNPSAEEICNGIDDDYIGREHV